MYTHHMASFPVPPESILDVCLCHGARRAARLLTRVYDGALAGVGLTAGQFAVLAAIAARGPVNVTALGDLMRMETSTLSRTLKPLRASGYITGTAGSGRRAGLVELTADGRSLLAEAIAAWQGAQRTATQALGGGTASTVLEALEATVKALGNVHMHAKPVGPPGDPS